MEHDKETHRLVGSVLPSDDKGLLLTDCFMAVSFHAKVNSFKVGKVAKYAFVYMAQFLRPDVPAFCLACKGTDNKFTADLILIRWKYIFLECNKRRISVVNFGADGSRELSAMQKSAPLMCKCLSLDSLKSDVKSHPIPSSWLTWFAIKKSTSISIGSNSPGMSRIVLEFLTLSCVLDVHIICPGSVGRTAMVILGSISFFFLYASKL